MSNFYNGNGELVNLDIKSALLSAVANGDVNLGSAIGATLSYISPGTAWEANAETAYNNMLEAYKKVPNSGIPFFISTDQHGRGVEVNRWLNNHDKDVNGMGVMNLNLGDTVTDVFSKAGLLEIYNRSYQIKNHISVFGNHEVKMASEVPNLYDLNRCFISTRDRKCNAGPMGCFAVVDDAHAVKYICVSNYIVGESGSVVKGLDTSAAKWLLEELTANDGYDIVYLQHWPVWTSKRTRAVSVETADSENHSASYNYRIWRLLVARKEKESGAFEDSDGISHSYDFSGCDGELLITLHGHNHAENISTVDGLTAYAADMCGDTRKCTFGLIDRLGSKVTFWVFDSMGCLEPLILQI